MADGKVREELAELTEAVRELRDREIAGEIRELRAEIEKLRAEKALHHCHGCSCVHVTWTSPAWTPTPYVPPYTITCGDTSTSIAAGSAISVPAVSAPAVGTFTLNSAN